jgi:hypothetical protein
MDRERIAGDETVIGRRLQPSALMSAPVEVAAVLEVS